jgi:Spy/CpxP family protein refolding chaperone
MWKLAVLALAIPAMLAAQGPRGPRVPRDWWDNPVADGLNLSDAQRKQIQTTIREYRNRLVDARAAVDKAEGAMDDVFNSDGAVDQKRANEAVDRLASARSDLTKVVSQMSLRMRGVLNTQQWQELQRRRGGGPGRFDAKPGPDGPRRFGPRGPRDPQDGPGPAAPPPGNPPNPAPAKPAVL